MVQADATGPRDGNSGVGVLRDAALVAGIGLHQLQASQRQMLGRAVARTPRPVLIAAGTAAVTAIAAVIHFTGLVPAIGATTGLPRTGAPLRPPVSD